MQAIKDLTYFATGGSCHSLLSPSSLSELQTDMKHISPERPFYILGAGSNSLAMDTDFPGTVLSLHRLKGLERRGDHIYAEAGCLNNEVTLFSLQHSLAGLSWMHRLPGQIGATTRMNARCYGGEISQVVKRVWTVDLKGQLHCYENDKLFYGYKNTYFMTSSEVIVAVLLTTQRGLAHEIKQQMDYCEQDRQSKDQFLYPSCGCVFKNDYTIGVPSGMLLQAAQVHELSTANAMINPKHANFVFNKGAGANEILSLTLAMRDRVYEHFGVMLEYEMEVLGLMPEPLRSQFLTQRSSQPKEMLLEPLRQAFQAR